MREALGRNYVTKFYLLSQVCAISHTTLEEFYKILNKTWYWKTQFPPIIVIPENYFKRFVRTYWEEKKNDSIVEKVHLRWTIQSLEMFTFTVRIEQNLLLFKLKINSSFETKLLRFMHCTDQLKRKCSKINRILSK